MESGWEQWKMMRNDVTEDGDTESSGICPRTGSGRCGKSIGKATQMVFFFHIYVCLQEGIESLEFLFFVGWMELDCFLLVVYLKKTVMVVFHFQTVA